ncbi:hypothetical protein [Streptomyces violascens]|uniref:hypothetical protein n=1 Tax=Streptomyces violascens TaxID=67381 RepID=UPI0036923880
MHVAILEDADVIYLEELVARLAGIPALIPTALSLLRDAHAHLRVHVAHMEPEGAPHLHGRTPRKQPPPRRPGLQGRSPSGDLALQQGLRIGPRLMAGAALSRGQLLWGVGTTIDQARSVVLGEGRSGYSMAAAC